MSKEKRNGENGKRLAEAMTKFRTVCEYVEKLAPSYSVVRPTGKGKEIVDKITKIMVTDLRWELGMQAVNPDRVLSSPGAVPKKYLDEGMTQLNPAYQSIYDASVRYNGILKAIRMLKTVGCPDTSFPRVQRGAAASEPLDLSSFGEMTTEEFGG